MAAIFDSVRCRARLEVRIRNCRYLKTSSGMVVRGEWRERYLERSKLPTQYFQTSLPRLPIPSLQQTMSRYLAAQKPLLSTDDYRRTEKLADEFAKESSNGWKVNQQLVERDRSNLHTSYVAKFWLDRFLKDRRPLVLNVNAYLGLKRDPRSPSQIDRAVNLINSSVRFWNSVTENKLKPDLIYRDSSGISPQLRENLIQCVPQKFASKAALLLGAIPLDMSQYKNLFGTTRIPKHGKDESIISPSSQHVIVMRNGHLYAVEALQANGLPTDPDQLYSTLSAIVSDPSPHPRYPVSYLTGINRDTWADVRNELIADPRNARTLEKVESALFVVCLDDRESETTLDAMHTFLHNYGANRWFDKSLQLVVSSSADAGVVFEHSWGDSATVLGYMNRVFLDTIKHPYIPSSTTTTPVFERLHFSLTENLMGAVEKARYEVEKKCQSFSASMMETCGKSVFKSKGVSPNSTLQLAFQMAYYHRYGRFDATVHPCSTATSLHGRTEWIRPGTMAAKACAEAFKPFSGASTAEKMRLLKETTAQISQLSREANKGHGFDRHLYALKCVAEEEGVSLALFEDAAYTQINHPILYPSTVNAEAISTGAFGPLCSDGFGIGYIMKEEAVYILASAYSAEKLDTFVSNLKTVLQDIHNVIM